MRFDSLSQPVSDEEPSGPDLDEAMDTDYLNYTLVAADRLPTGYLVQVPGGDGRKPFDRSTIELDKEVETIARLLERSRDIRLLTLDARFNAAAGKIIGFSEATQGLNTVVSGFWDSFHPKPADGDMIVRQNTIESLDDLGQIVLHLQNAPLAGGGRTRPVSLRNYLVATGKAEAREDEEAVPADAISLTMSGVNQKGERVPADFDAVTAVNDAIKAAIAALHSIRTIFLEKAGPEFTPGFTNLLAMFQQMLDMIGVYRSDLAPPKPAGEAGSTDGYEGDEGGAITLSGAVKTHGAAAAALAAAESYFLRLEPSSPALILVHQSRMLIGQPLTFALEALMPEPSMRAALRFDAGFRFDIDLPRMKSVTDDALANMVPEPSTEDGSGWGETPAEESSSSSNDGWGDWGSSTSDATAEETPEATAEIAEGAPAGDESEYVSEETTAEPEATPLAPPAPPIAVPAGPTTFRAATRAQAADLIQATETFFRAAEPSSPIPLLLSKARTYISKDFASILSELIPREQPTE